MQLSLFRSPTASHYRLVGEVSVTISWYASWTCKHREIIITGWVSGSLHFKAKWICSRNIPRWPHIQHKISVSTSCHAQFRGENLVPNSFSCVDGVCWCNNYQYDLRSYFGFNGWVEGAVSVANMRTEKNVVYGYGCGSKVNEFLYETSPTDLAREIVIKNVAMIDPLVPNNPLTNSSRFRKAPQTRRTDENKKMPLNRACRKKFDAGRIYRYHLQKKTCHWEKFLWVYTYHLQIK